MGFVKNTTYTSSSNNIILPYCCNFMGINRLKIKSGIIQTNNLDSYSRGRSNMLCSIPVSSAPGGVIIYNNISQFKSIFPNNNLDYIDISIADDDFLKLLSVVTEEDSVELCKNGKKRNRYRTWTKASFELAAFTGMRLEEVATLKYSDIKLNQHGELDYLEGIDLKYQRANNWDSTKAKKLVPIPITPELEDLLNQLNYKQNLGADRYLIDGDCKMSRSSLAKEMSHSFTFYRRKAGLSDSFSIKHLRKTFLTKLESQTGLTESAGYQKTLSVIHKNYIDKKQISRDIQEKGFSYYRKSSLNVR